MSRSLALLKLRSCAIAQFVAGGRRFGVVRETLDHVGGSQMSGCATWLELRSCALCDSGAKRVGASAELRKETPD